MQEEKNNDKLKVISVDELRQFEGMENLSIEEAEHKIKVIKELSFNLFEIFKNEKIHKNISKA